jgi:hypothetical protein
VKRKVCWALAVTLFLFSQPGLCELPYADLGLSNLLFPAESKDHKIEKVEIDPERPGFLIFTVSSPHALYQIEGLVLLRQYLSEIKVIESLGSTNPAKDAAVGVVESVKDTVFGLKNMIVHPVKSVTGVTTAVGKMGQRFGRAFREKHEGEKISVKESVLGATKRVIAVNLGVDFYSRNTYLQEKLDAMAAAQIGGRGAFMIAKFFVPILFAISVVAAAASINAAADRVVNDSSRPDLYQINKKALTDLGFALKDVTKLLDSPFYTPREVTYLRFYLEALKPVPGYEQIMYAALSATSEPESLKLLYEAQLAADAYSQSAEILKIFVLPEGLTLLRRDDLIFIVGYDYLDDSEFGKGIAGKAESLRGEFNRSSAQLWLSGVADRGLTARLKQKKIQMRKLALFVREPAVVPDTGK